MFLRNRTLVAVLSVAVVAQLGTGAMNALDIFFLGENLHADLKLLGIVSMAFGLGTIVGSLVAGRVVMFLTARRVVWLCLVVAGVIFTLYARQTAIVPGILLIFLFAMPVAILNAAASPILLGAMPKEYVGRMMAVFLPVNMGASTLSVAVAGWIASAYLHDFRAKVLGLHIGGIDTIFAIAALLLVVAGIYAYYLLGRAPDASPRPTLITQGGPPEPVQVVVEQ
jgi:MFS family permease